MELSPQSGDVVARLLNNETLVSGNTTIGPLNSETKLVLRSMADNIEAFQRLKGESLLQDFRKAYKTYNAEANEKLDYTNQIVKKECREWKIIELKCKAIRGIAPQEEEFTFEFNSDSTLIYGPNGSGKSSIIASIIWALTGKVSTDSEDSENRVSITTLNDVKQGEWDVIQTLPDSVKLNHDDYYSQIKLKDKQSEILYLKRSKKDGLQYSNDGVQWSECTTLKQFGISPIDLQLSLIASTTLGKKGIESAEDARSLLSLMLGYDDIETLGELSKTLARARTVKYNSEQDTINEKRNEIKQDLDSLLKTLPETSSQYKLFKEKLNSGLPIKEIVEKLKSDFLKAISDTEIELANSLGIKDKEAPKNLITNLTVLLDKLESGILNVFPTLGKITPKVLFAEETENCGSYLESIENSVNRKKIEVKSSIESRYKWFLEELKSHGRIRLLLQGAKLYDPKINKCPICERTITDPALSEELKKLNSESDDAIKELKSFFLELSDQIESLIPPELRPFLNKSAAESLKNDWDIFEKDLRQRGLASILDELSEKPLDLISASFGSPTKNIYQLSSPTDNATFVKESEVVVHALSRVDECLSLARWSITTYPELLASLTNTICGSEDKSLLFKLSLCKTRAEEITPLITVCNNFQGIARKVEKLNELISETKTLIELQDPLDRLKDLAKYAQSEVKIILSSINHDTISNWNILYPEHPTGLAAANISLSKGRDKKIEAFLAGKDFKVPLHYFANAGWQRAVALSFYFALLKRHLKGIAFFILDDPILSLDDEHRENWVNDLLRDSINEFQVIFASHQQHFIKYCLTLFKDSSIIELNPRMHRRPITMRPGFLLKRAEKQIDTNWSDTGNLMRQYTEQLLWTLDGYSQDSFLNGTRQDWINSYADIKGPSKLSHKNQKDISNILKSKSVNQVLNPQSHGLTREDVTHAMVKDCFKELQHCDAIFKEEVGRLEKIRKHKSRSTIIPVNVIEFPKLPESSICNNTHRLNVIGSAAAKSGHYIVDMSNEGDFEEISISDCSAVVATGNTLDPVIRTGQWILLKNEIEAECEGQLAAIATTDMKLLRRVSNAGDNWLLTSINPIQYYPPIIIRKTDGCPRRIIGVLYQSESVKSPKNNEWCPNGKDIYSSVSSLCAIHVQGDSLAPVAFSGQRVLISKNSSDLATINNGDLAVIDTGSGEMGIVIKRIFFNGEQCILASHNPVDPIEPILIAKEKILKIWSLKGVLFES